MAPEEPRRRGRPSITVQGGKRAKKRPHLFDQVGDRYLQQFISLREINQLADLASRADVKTAEIAKDVARLNEEERQEYHRVVEAFKHFPLTAPESDEPVNGGITPSSTVDDEDGNDELQITINSPEVSAVIRAIFFQRIHRLLAPDKNELIAQSLVASAVSSFEVLVGSVAKEAFKINKTALAKSEHEFTLEELSTYDSIEEARAELINRRVDALLLGSVDEWSKWSERVLQFGLPELTANWPDVREIFARRNVIVHNAAEINRRYLNTVRASQTDLPANIQVGDLLKTDNDYVDRSIQQILALGLNLIYTNQTELVERGS